MPLLFSYGTLQRQEIQLRTYGRVLNGEQEVLTGFAPDKVSIEDPEIRAATGLTHYQNARFTNNPADKIHGMLFELSNSELLETDSYEAPANYVRVKAVFETGRSGWVYAFRDRLPPSLLESADTV